MNTGPERSIEALAAAAKSRGIELTIMMVAKLLYLADLRAVRQDGQAYSGIRWLWDNHGPWNNAIYTYVERDRRRGVIDVQEFLEPVRTKVVTATSSASTDAGDFLEHIEAILEAYGHLAPSELRDLTYQTSPMIKAQADEAHKRPLDLTVRPAGSWFDTATALGDDDLYFDDEGEDLPRWTEEPEGPLMSVGRALYRRR